MSLALLVGCPSTAPRVARSGASEGPGASGDARRGPARAREAGPPLHVSLPRDQRTRYLQDGRPLPLPTGGLLVHLELGLLRRLPQGKRVTDALWEGLRVQSAGKGLLYTYLRRCGVDLRRDARAVTLVQPLEGRPGADRVVVMWGLLGARRLVGCLGDAAEKDGARAVMLRAGGEPALGLDRAVSDLHLDVMALDGETALVAAGLTYRRAVQALVSGQGEPVVSQALYQRAVASAPPGTVLLALVPRFPRRLPHVFVPGVVPRHFRGATFHARLDAKGMAVAGTLRVSGEGRAQRWAQRLPGRSEMLMHLLPPGERPYIARVKPSAQGPELRLELQVTSEELPALGRLAERWLPW